MSYGGGGFGGQADTGGVAGGSSSSSSNSGGSNSGNLGSELGTSGPGQGYGSGHNSTGSAGGGTSSSAGGSSSSSYGGTFGDSLDARSTSRSASRSASMVGPNAMVSMDQEADTAINSFMDALDANPISMQEATSRAQESIQANAKPGMLGNLATFGLTALGQPVAAYGVNSMARGYNAQQAAEAHNAEFGTSVDEGTMSNMGSQAVGTVAGVLGSKAGGRTGSSLGASVGGVPGAIVGGIAGSALGGNLGREAAMSPGDPSPGNESPGDTNNSGAGTGGGGGLIAAEMQQSRQQPANQPTPSGRVSIDDYGYGADRGNAFDRYSDYATQFFA